MGKQSRDEFLKKNGISKFDFLPERIYSRNDIRAIPRKHTADFSSLFIPREQEIRPYLTLNNNETFVDVGANVGQYSLAIARDTAHLNVKIIAIEAHPGNYWALCRNIALNRFDNVVPINKAISDHTGLVPLYQSVPSDFHIWSGIYTICQMFDGKSLADNPSVQVECDTLDNVLANCKADVLKMDIEGSEVQALNGAKKTLKHLRAAIIEIHENSFEKVSEILQSNNFRTKIIAIPTTKNGGFVVGLK